MIIRFIFTEPFKPAHPAFRYGMLAVTLCLLTADIRWYLSLPPDWPYDRYGGFIAILSMLFTQLLLFRWPTSVTVILRVLTLGWVLFAAFYVFYLVRILYPLP